MLVWGTEARTGELKQPSLLPLSPYSISYPGHAYRPKSTGRYSLCKSHKMCFPVSWNKLFLLLLFSVPMGWFCLQKFPVFLSQNCHKKPPHYLASLYSTHGFLLVWLIWEKSIFSNRSWHSFSPPALRRHFQSEGRLEKNTVCLNWALWCFTASPSCCSPSYPSLRAYMTAGLQYLCKPAIKKKNLSLNCLYYFAHP